ncbi:outer membrane protein transport protein [bacterium]|nr:outer membrane protein transport protein [bacterium]
MKKLTQNATALLFLLMITSSVMATDGYFSHGYGTKHKAMGGTGVAFPLNSMSVVTNPAGVAFLGNSYDFGLALFNPNRQYTVVGNPSMQPNTFGLTPGTVKSKSKYFFIPSLGINRTYGDNTFNIALFGNGGMNTDYNTATFYDPNSSKTGVNLSQLFLSLTYARKINENHSLGITGIFAYQMFEAKGLNNFGNFSRDNTKLTNNGSDNSTGYGVRVGYYGKLMENLSLGASFQSKIYMSEFKDYAGLFAEQGDFDIPANWTAGVAFKANEDLTLTADVQQIFYSGVKSVGNPMNPANFQTGIFLGDNKGAGFGWNDMMIYKVGAQWLKGEGWAWRMGYSYGKQPIPKEEMMFNILAPGVIEQHATFGFSKALANKHEIHFAAMFGFSKEISGPNVMEMPNQQTIKLKMSQMEFEVGYSF